MYFYSNSIVPHSHGNATAMSLDKRLALSGLASQIELFSELLKRGVQETKNEGGNVSDSAHTLTLASID
jgi:hypothetical protein